MENLTDLEKFLNTVETKEINEIVGSVLAQGDFDAKKEVRQQFPYTRRVSVNDIVPEAYQQRLMEIDFTMTQCYWLIGDIAADLVNSVNREKAQLLGKVVSKQDIFEAIGFFCHRTGRSVRYYYECAHFFSVELRQKYEVPFCIYAEARWVHNWELLLRISSENPMWSAERVRFEYQQLTGEIKEVRQPQDHGAEVPEEIYNNLPLPDNGDQWEGGQQRFKAVLLSKLDHTVDDLRSTVDKIPLPVEIKKRIGDVILEIQDIGLEIRREC